MPPAKSDTPRPLTAIRVDSNNAYHVRMMAERQSVPIRVITDFVADLATAALEPTTSKITGEPKTTPPQIVGGEALAISRTNYERLELACRPGGVSCSTAWLEMYLAVRSKLEAIKVPPVTSLSGCWTSIAQAQRDARRAKKEE